jgi:hypothetical protein
VKTGVEPWTSEMKRTRESFFTGRKEQGRDI